MLLQPWAERAHEGGGEIRHRPARHHAQHSQHRYGKNAEQRVGGGLDAALGPPNPSTHTRRRRSHHSVTTIFPKTCLLSSRDNACSYCASGSSVSITGRSPCAILARLSRMFRMDAPNEPMIRYCCWKSCIRLIVADGPDVAPQVTRRPPRLRHKREPLKVSAPTCSKTTSTPFLPVIL